MNPINDLFKFLEKADDEGGVPFSQFASSGTAPAQVGTGGQAASTSAVQEVSTGASSPTESEIPAQFRMYLSSMPGHKVPESFQGKTYTGQRGSAYIDQRQLSSAQKDEMHPHDDAKDISYGGVIINANGEILLRKPKGEKDGYKWTFAKGGADDADASIEDSAKREVKEETGLDCEIVGHIPGHFQSGVNNKFFLMKVTGGNDKHHQSDETEDVQFFSKADAEAQIKLTGDDNDNGMKRDLAVLNAAFHEHHKSKDTHDKLNETLHSMNTKGPIKHIEWNDSEFVKDQQQYFYEHGQLSPDLVARDNPDAETIRNDIHRRMFNFKDTSNSIGTFARKLFNSEAMQEKYGKNYDGDSNIATLRDKIINGWVGNPSASRRCDVLAELLGERLGSPQTKIGSNVVISDIDEHGRKMFRSMEGRDALVKAYEDWQAGGPAQGDLPSEWDEDKKDYAKSKQFNFTLGGEVTAAKRAVAVKKDRASSDMELKQTLKEVGEHLPKISEDESDSEAGKRMYRDLIHLQTGLTRQMLDLACPDADSIYLYRGTSAVHEVVGKSPGQAYKPQALGSDRYDKAKLEALGMPKLGSETVDNAYENYVHARPGSGWSPLPKTSFGSEGAGITLAAEVPKHNIFAMAHDMNLHSMQGEQEWIVMNNPNLRAKIMHHGYKSGTLLNASKDWKIDSAKVAGTNGWHVDGLFKNAKGIGVNTPAGTWKVGVQEPNRDWSAEGKLEQVPGVTGTAPGGVFTDKDGQQWYIKHGREDQHVVESLANDVYRKAGINVPETQLINWDGKVAHASKMLPNAKTDASGDSLANSSSVKEGVFIDALLSNHDFIGVGPENPYGNIVESNGTHYRIDNGGSMYLTGQGNQKSKSFTEVDPSMPIEEIGAFLDPSQSSISPRAAKVFNNMSQTEIKQAAMRLEALNNTNIANMVHASGIPPYKMEETTAALVTRRNNIVQYLADKKLYRGTKTSISGQPQDYTKIVEQLGLYKAETVMEDNPIVDKPLAYLMKQPALFCDEHKYSESYIKEHGDTNDS
jgi:8-oxo-dGTP pyrophosphatase MutT (NUDIX family)